jgi:alginate O-acetyltransferase complex protein AlgI
MTFSSIPFLVFLLFILITEPWFSKNRHAYLSVVSLTFYIIAGAELVVLLVISSAIDHLSVRNFDKKRRKWWLIIAISANLLFLVGVKINYYLDFKFFKIQNLIPLGISFYTLQSISYLVDVFNKKSSKIDSFTAYLAYISFFPQLIAGPIERCNKLYPQLNNFGLTETHRALRAIRLFIFGLYLKLVISNRLVGPINQVASTNEYDIVFLLNGIFVFAYVYIDFFAYTLMARGISGVFGVEISLNFDRPFSRKNLIAFWQSWHISLTKWMIDYFYIPIMLRIKSSALNKFLFSVCAMILIGLWHGIGWNFVVFGFVNGASMQLLPLIDKTTQQFSLSLPKFNNRFGMILVLALSGNIFLFEDADQLLSLLSAENYELLAWTNLHHYTSISFAIGVISLVPLLIHEFSKSSYLYQSICLKYELLIIGTFILLISIFWSEGGSHVYFAF